MADVLFTLPGKLGDNLLRLPAAYQYARQNEVQVDLVVDDQWSRNLPDLLRREIWVDTVECWSGVDRAPYGGQPYHFGRRKEFAEKWPTVYHLGYRTHPEKTDDLTYFALKQSGCPIDTKALWTEPCLSYPVPQEAPREAVLHFDASAYDYRIGEVRNAVVKAWLQILARFQKIWIVCRPEMRQEAFYGTFLKWEKVAFFEDSGDLSRIADLLAGRVLIGTNSAIWALARCIKSRSICLLNRGRNRVVPRQTYPRERILFLDREHDLLAAVDEVME